GEQYRSISLVDKARGYGMEGVTIDGNNILTVFDTIKGVRDYCVSNQKPYLVECLTFRMRGHEEASGTKYIPQKLFEIWQLKDPVNKFEEYIKSIKVLSDEDIGAIKNEFKEKIEEELKIAFAAKPMEADMDEELDDVYASSDVRRKTSGKVVDNSKPTHHSPLITHDKRF